MPSPTVIVSPAAPGVPVNAYLAATRAGFVLIDTGASNQRRAVVRALERAGCTPGNLALIALTHGDADHCGNAAFLRAHYGAPIALHPGDLGMVERGDMFWNRRAPNRVLRALMGRLLGLGAAHRFSPDVLIDADGASLADCGFDATVLHLPGHSVGSVGFLTPDGALFCGDLLANLRRPGLWWFVDDRAVAAASVDKLRARDDVHMVYPGHGQPFPLRPFLDSAAGEALRRGA